ncbi:MAG: hypothetical protein RLZZ230_627 [Candidatus Parcubacteria bacterium]|jgi:signal transduction histidine kinase
MISNILHTLEKGIGAMRLNSRFMLVGVLVFVFPLLFVWVTQSFFATAYSNIETIEKSRVRMLHSNFVTVLKYDNTEKIINDLIATAVNEDEGITKIHIVKKDNDGFKIIYASDTSVVGEYEKNDGLYRALPLSASDELFIVPTVINGSRIWQVFKSVNVSDQQLTVFTEHSFVLTDSVMAARRQQSYFGLTAIFIFLIALAYWLNKQVYWEKNHALLSQQMQERDLFSNMIAHEFRTPLTAIKGYASFLQESKSISTEEMRFVGNIRTSAERLVILVNDFLEVSRIQSGQLKIELTDVDVRLVVQRVTEDLQGLATDKNLKLSYIKTALPVMLNTDEARLTQALTNLLSNAIKYTDKGGVELEVTDTRAGVTIRIKDTGMGISAADQQKLFAPFTRVGNVDSTNITGTGLGMWITKQLVTLLNGTVGIESIKGVGTHVVLNFKD